MRVCDLNTGVGKLSQAYSKLKEQWAQTQVHWQDDTCRRFEEEHLREIPARLQFLLAGVQRLAEVLEKAERECEDRADEA